eukprot:COSAG06_NODE_16182_length_1015_cov_14.652838_1_plen_111_part_00
MQCGGMRFYAFNLLAGGLLTDKRAETVKTMTLAATTAGGGSAGDDEDEAPPPPADGGRFDPAQAGPMKIGEEYTARYWRPAYLSALKELSDVCEACEGGPIPVQDAAQRW